MRKPIKVSDLPIQEVTISHPLYIPDREPVKQHRKTIQAVPRSLKYAPPTRLSLRSAKTFVQQVERLTPGGKQKDLVIPANYRLKSWPKLVEAYLPDAKVLRRHKQALDAKKYVKTSATGYTAVPDHDVRLDAVKLGYQLKHKMAEPSEGSSTTNVNIAIIAEEIHKAVEEINKE